MGGRVERSGVKGERWCMVGRVVEGVVTWCRFQGGESKAVLKVIGAGCSRYVFGRYGNPLESSCL